jgi:CDP-diacylglycerol--serine O-phosphatidyltransferase
MRAGENSCDTLFIILAADSMPWTASGTHLIISQFGVEIDSLSDVVSFGAAPAFLVYQFALGSLGGIGIFLSSLLMIFAGLRLARFNVQLVGFDKDHFVGLPVPASAITVASFVLNVMNNVEGFVGRGTDILPWLSVVLAVLMVSKVPYDTLPRVSRRAIRKEPWKFIFAVLAILVVVVTGGNAIFPLLVVFILLGIIRYCCAGQAAVASGPRFEEDERVRHSRIDSRSGG